MIRDVKTKVQGLADEKEQILGEHQDLVKRRAKLELDIKDLQEEIDGDKSAKVSPLRSSEARVDNSVVCLSNVSSPI